MRFWCVGDKAETTAASSFFDTADALENASALSADAMTSLGTVEAVKAANLAAYEAELVDRAAFVDSITFIVR
jgi:hypothetical protein